MKSYPSSARLVLLLACLILPALFHRIYLSFQPYTNFDPFGYNLPHLFTGILLMTIGGLPMVIGFANIQSRIGFLFAMVFMIGLSLALDEWVYLIATDGTDDQYLWPVSWWGSGVMIVLASAYLLVLAFMKKR